ncbi:integrase core domain-containing protein [Streptomyces sp. NPDC059900]
MGRRCLPKPQDFTAPGAGALHRLRTERFRPAHAPSHLRAYIERWIGGCRRELLDRTLITNKRHLRNVPATYETHFTAHRPHRALHQAAPLRPLPRPGRPGRHGHLSRSTQWHDPRIHTDRIERPSYGHP